MKKGPVKVAIVGLGGRGKDTYAPCALRFPEKMQIVAVADPVSEKRAVVADQYNIPQNMCFSSAEELLGQDKLADAVFICTQDRMHYSQAIAALKKGYHVLLEKPISPDPGECAQIAKTANECKRHVQVCHVLRYTPFYQEIRRILDSGKIGEVVTIQAMENVQYWHQAHSYVRGNWAREETASPMILAKCCHDMDILLWLAGRKSRYVSSYGGLYLFCPQKAPEGAAHRCMDGCGIKDSCPYDAEKIYLTNQKTGLLQGKRWWPVNILNINPTPENIRQALKEGDYGRCVYFAGNNVVDHQVVNVELEDGITINFTMSAFTSRGGRTLKVMGTLGDIEADMEENTIRVGVFGEDAYTVDVNSLAEDFSGHGGGDFRMVEELLCDILEEKEPGCGLTSIDKSVESHYLAMAAEESRQNHGQSICMEEWIQRLKCES